MKHKRRVWPWLLPAIIIFCLICFCFVINQWNVDIVLQGESEITLECGETYSDPGAEAFLGGTIFPDHLFSLKVDIEDHVDYQHPGIYKIEYSAGLLWYQSTAVRTLTLQDTLAPELVLKEDQNGYTLPGHPYEEPGFTATDMVDGDLTDAVVAEERDGKIYYSVTDSSGNTATAVREIIYNDPLPPEITLMGEETMELPAGTPYEEPGFRAEDNCDGDLTDKVTISGGVDQYHAGYYEITYTVEDSFHNTASIIRKINVVPVPQPDKVDPGDNVVYLTFDDGPSQYTSQLLDVLDRYNVKATFFVVDTGYEEMIGEEHRRGHTVAVHTACHSYDKIYASEDAYFSDFNKMSDIIYQQTGTRPTMLRFPGGSSNTVSCFNPGIMSRLAQDVTDLGYQYYDWNVSSGDAGETTDTDVVAQNVIDGMRNHNVSIVLQHDIKGFSVAAVEQIIVWGLANGYTFLPLTPGSPTAHHGINN